MARHKTPEAEIRRALAEGMKAGFAMGYDRATRLAQSIDEAWGDEASGIANELQKLRAKVLEQCAADVNSTVDDR